MFEKQNKYYVYVYLDPTKSGYFKFEGLERSFKFEPFYVGKGCGKREFYHNYTAKKSNKTIDRKYCSGYCQELHLRGFDPIIIRYQENMLEDEAYELEKKLIKCIGRKSHNEGSLLNYHSDEMKKQLSENHKANMKKARRLADQNRIKEIFDIMISNGDTFESERFNKVTYELARSKVYARMYPKFGKILEFFSEKEIKRYFADKK